MAKRPQSQLAIHRRKSAPETAPVSFSNDLQWALIKRVTAGEPRQIAASVLGISDEYAEEILSAPVSRIRFRARMAALLLMDGAPLALKTLTELAGNQEVPAHVRRLAASDLLARAGFGPAVGAVSEDTDRDKAPSELSTDELRQVIKDLQTEIAQRARDVTPQDSWTE